MVFIPHNRIKIALRAVIDVIEAIDIRQYFNLFEYSLPIWFAFT